MSYHDYQQPPSQPYGGPPPQQSSGAATASLILGICGFLVCPLICSILAIVFAKKAYAEIDASGGRVGGRGLAQAGLILGWIGIAFGVLALVAVVAWFVFVVRMIESGDFESAAVYMALQP